MKRIRILVGNPLEDRQRDENGSKLGFRRCKRSPAPVHIAIQLSQSSPTVPDQEGFKLSSRLGARSF